MLLQWWCKTKNVIWEISNHNVQEGVGGRQFDINQQVYPICLLNYHVPEGWLVSNIEGDPMTIGTIWHISGQRVSIINADVIERQVRNLAVCCQ